MSALDVEKLIGEVEAPTPERPQDRDFECPVCGQMVDRQSLTQMHHHIDGPHEPMAPDEHQATDCKSAYPHRFSRPAP